MKDYDSNKERASARDKPRKRMLESSSDCSFLERALASDPRPQTLDMHNVVEGIDIQGLKTRRQCRKLERSVGLEGTVVSLSINPQVESFEKRRRHKTREDRYEPKRALVNPKSQVNREKKREKKEKAKSRRKVPRNTGEDLMHQFSSKSVGLDRLTVCALKSALSGDLLIIIRCVPLIPLVYSKTAEPLLLGDDVDVSNVASRFVRSTNAVSTVPDLAFSEMEFLRRPKHYPAGMEEENSLSKSREKEKRRSQRAQNEISEYFKPSTEASVEVEKADRQKASYASNVDHKLRQGEIGKHRYQSSYSKSTSQSIDLSKQPFLGLDRRYAFEQLAAMPHLRGQMVQPGVVPVMTRNLSDRDTTYYTWSDSARSPDISQNKQKTCSVVSTTPESIRQMLNDTGIFRNTGIDRTTSRIHEKAREEPVESKVYTKAARLSKIPNCVSPPTHSRKSSHTTVQSRQQVETGEPTLRIRRSPCEPQKRHLYETGSRARDGGEVLHPAKPIIQHYRAETGWQEHSTDREGVTHYRLSKANGSQHGISRQVIAQGAYVKHAPTTSTAVRGVDDTNNTTLSARAPEAERTMPHIQSTEQVMYEESSAETAVHCPPLSSGVKKPERDSCSTGTDEAKPLADPFTNHGHLIQSSKAATSDLIAERQVDTVRVTDGLQAPSRTTETITELPITYKRANDGIDQIGGSNIAGHVHEATRGPVFEGLPVRGSWPSRAIGPIYSSHTVYPPMIIESLYNHQLENRILHDLADPNYNQSVLMEQVLHRFDTPLMEHSHNGDSELYDTFESEYELVNGTSNLQEYDLTFSNELDSGPYVVEEAEEEPTLWVNHDISHQAAARQHIYEGSHSADSLNQQQSSVIDSNFNGEGHYYHRSHTPVRGLVRAEDGGEHHDLNPFWRPRRQY